MSRPSQQMSNQQMSVSKCPVSKCQISACPHTESKLGQKARKNEISIKFQITNYQASNKKNYSFQLTIDTSKKVIAQHYVLSSYINTKWFENYNIAIRDDLFPFL